MIPNTNFEKISILKAIEEFPEGASIEDIIFTSGLKLPRRTLQRRLDDLRKSGEIVTIGVTRGLRYYLTKEAPLRRYFQQL